MLMIEKEFLGISLPGCSNVHHFDTPMSSSIAQQAVSRVGRLGQRRPATYYQSIRLQSRQSHNCWQILSNVNKAIPGMVAGLNSDIFKV